MDNQKVLEDLYQALLDEGCDEYEAHEIAQKLFWSNQ
tara:strand:- start:44 stop:154 length:111 start_codon:yes stop_codon:yes gene_type:complete